MSPHIRRLRTVSTASPLVDSMMGSSSSFGGLCLAGLEGFARRAWAAFFDPLERETVREGLP
jgi:hypothetical protein